MPDEIPDKFIRLKDGEPAFISPDECELLVCPSCGMVSRVEYGFINNRVMVRRFMVTKEEFEKNKHLLK